MTSLYIDRRGVELRLDGEALAFYENGSRIGTVPLAPINRIFMRGDIKLHSGLLGKLGNLGIGVIVLSGRESSVSLLLAKPHNDASRRISQYKLSMDHNFVLNFSKAIVELKLRDQSTLLSELRETNLKARYELTARMKHIQSAVQSINEQTSIASLRGLEGHGAAEYFAGLAAHLPNSLKFSGRNRRPPRDPVNAALSLGYTLLHSETVVALYGAGLDPFIGFYHQLDFGRESLACDFVETIRTDYDRFVLNLFRNRELDADDFSISSHGCLLGKSARTRFYIAFEEIAEKFRKKITQNIRELINTIAIYESKKNISF